MLAESKTRLLGVEPDIARYLTPAERDAAKEISLPVREVKQGRVDIRAILGRSNAFGALILDGMLLHRLEVCEQPTLRLLGSGDIVSLSGAAPSMLVEAQCTATVPTKLAMLGNDLLAGIHRWPRLAAGLHLKMAEQAERLSVPLAICQLPRVDQRLLALMWLLAESWGHVTSLGTRLPLTLTHDALGGLIGARRPTVSLALRELSDRGTIVRQEAGWLLLGEPPLPGGARAEISDPMPIEGPALSSWADQQERATAEDQAHEELKATVRRLSDEHHASAIRFQERMVRLRDARELAGISRRTIARERLRRQQAPSS